MVTLKGVPSGRRRVTGWVKGSAGGAKVKVGMADALLYVADADEAILILDVCLICTDMCSNWKEVWMRR
jgi:hypothetical protein